MLDYIRAAGLDTIGVGKIYDIFDGEGVSEKLKTTGNANGMEVTLELAQRGFSGLAFVNLVDFDMVYGHRNDVDGYANAATEFDGSLQSCCRCCARRTCSSSRLITVVTPRPHLPIIRVSMCRCSPMAKVSVRARTWVQGAALLALRRPFASIWACLCSWTGKAS